MAVKGLKAFRFKSCTKIENKLAQFINQAEFHVKFSSIRNRFHLEISHCGATRARMSSSRITVTNLSVKTAKVGLKSTKVGWILVRV